MNLQPSSWSRGNRPEQLTLAELVGRNRDRGRLLTAEELNEQAEAGNLFDSTTGRRIAAVLGPDRNTPEDLVRGISKAVGRAAEFYPVGHLGDIAGLLRGYADEIEGAVADGR